MEIEAYSPGCIVIDSKEYHGDVIVYSDHVFNVWWREDGHNLQLVDLVDILESSPSELIIGTGYAQCMLVSDEVVAELKKLKIKFHILETHAAVELFNKRNKGKKVVAALHLTC